MICNNNIMKIAENLNLNLNLIIDFSRLRFIRQDFVEITFLFAWQNDNVSSRVSFMYCIA